MLQKRSDTLDRLRHSLAHVMAEAVQALFPGTKLAVGPPIDYGFYYDFSPPRPLCDADLAPIEEKMRAILRAGCPFVKEVVSRPDALARFKDEPFKQELIERISADDTLSLYHSGAFTDLCRGPHVQSMRDINPHAFKLTSIAGAYWRGNERGPQLTRIYGTAWESEEDLHTYLRMQDEAKRRDHRKLGPALGLFHLDEENPGQVFWHPEGWTLYVAIQQYLRRVMHEDEYAEVHTPFVMPQSLWERSGHWDKYRANMYLTEGEKRSFALKPMNCPGHVEIFKQKTRSYRDLPLRLSEFGSCTRNEPSGSLHGVMRVRGFVQDDAHIFCTEAQIASEVTRFCRLLARVYADFGFAQEQIRVKFSTRPEQRIGDDATWDRAERALAEACEAAGLSYEHAPGEGAFYGPKLEFALIDTLEREWQCGTIQVDYQLPSCERLNAEYVGEDNQRHMPVILHRTVIGSLERFIGILIEHYGGAFPPWLAPVQAVVIPVAPAFLEYAQHVARELCARSLRVQADVSAERMNAKIRTAQTQKVPYLLIVGERELRAQQVAVRPRTGPQHSMGLSAFSTFLLAKLETRALHA